MTSYAGDGELPEAQEIPPGCKFPIELRREAQQTQRKKDSLALEWTKGDIISNTYGFQDMYKLDPNLVNIIGRDDRYKPAVRENFVCVRSDRVTYEKKSTYSEIEERVLRLSRTAVKIFSACGALYVSPINSTVVRNGQDFCPPGEKRRALRIEHQDELTLTPLRCAEEWQEKARKNKFNPLYQFTLIEHKNKPGVRVDRAWLLHNSFEERVTSTKASAYSTWLVKLANHAENIISLEQAFDWNNKKFEPIPTTVKISIITGKWVIDTKDGVVLNGKFHANEVLDLVNNDTLIFDKFDDQKAFDDKIGKEQERYAPRYQYVFYTGGRRQKNEHPDNLMFSKWCKWGTQRERARHDQKRQDKLAAEEEQASGARRPEQELNAKHSEKRRKS